MVVLITGGCGQIGSHIAEYFVESGSQVVVVDTLVTGRMNHLPNSQLVVFYNVDISNSEALISIFEAHRPELVIHSAASYMNPYDWYQDVLVNSLGGVNIIKCSTRYKVGRFIYLQTALCYGTQPQSIPCGINDPLDPANGSYAISKTVAESYLILSGLNYVSFRLTNIIGPRNLAGPLPTFFNNLKLSKQSFVTKASRDFVDVRDLVKVIVKASHGIGKGVYNFSSGRSMSILSLYNMVSHFMGVEAYKAPLSRELGPDHAITIELDNSELIEDFGPIIFTPIEETVQVAISYYNMYGTLGEISHLKI